MGSEDCLFQFSDLTPTLFQFGEWCIHVPQYLCKIIPFAGEAFVILVYVKKGKLVCMTKVIERIVQVVK